MTGIQAAGKSTVAQALAERLERSVHLRGDVFRRMVVSGRAEMGPATPSAEAVRQLRLRYSLTANAADMYAAAGFDVVVQDIVIGSYLPRMVSEIGTRPLYVVVLAPVRVRGRGTRRQAAGCPRQGGLQTRRHDRRGTRRAVPARDPTNWPVAGHIHSDSRRDGQGNPHPHVRGSLGITSAAYSGRDQNAHSPILDGRLAGHSRALCMKLAPYPAR